MIDEPYYHGTIRKAIIAFGRLFSNIKIERRLKDSVNGEVQQTLNVPLAYAPKEKWLSRIEQEPSNEELLINTIVPRLSFEITGYSYDSSRKVPKINQIKNEFYKSYSPVPYNVDISLYILTKMNEDNLQIVEQTLPLFVPEYVVTINVIPSLGIKQDVPIAIGGITVDDQWEGDMASKRIITTTISFTMKLNLFGKINEKAIINKTDVTINEGERRHVAEAMPDGSIQEEWSGPL